MESVPKHITEHLDELTATVETLRAAVAALAEHVPDRSAVLKDYDDCCAHLQALVQGQSHPDAYLTTLETAVAHTRLFLAGPPT